MPNVVLKILRINFGISWSTFKIIVPYLQQFSKLRFCLELVEIRFCNQWSAEHNWYQIFMQPSCFDIHTYVEELYVVEKSLKYFYWRRLLRQDCSWKLTFKSPSACLSLYICCCSWFFFNKIMNIWLKISIFYLFNIDYKFQIGNN